LPDDLIPHSEAVGRGKIDAGEELIASTIKKWRSAMTSNQKIEKVG
jgi:hypothetical protein